MLNFNKYKKPTDLRSLQKAQQLVTNSNYIMWVELVDSKDFQVMIDTHTNKRWSNWSTDGQQNDKYDIQSKITYIDNELTKYVLPNSLLLGTLWNPNKKVVNKNLINHKFIYYITDIIRWNKINLNNHPFTYRRKILENIFGKLDYEYIQLLPVYYGKEKFRIFNQCKDIQTVVFLDISKPYSRSRPLRLAFPDTYYGIIQDIKVVGNKAISILLCQIRNGEWVTIGYCSGLTKEQGVAMATNKNGYIHKMVKFTAVGYGKVMAQKAKLVSILPMVDYSLCFWGQKATI